MSAHIHIATLAADPLRPEHMASVLAQCWRERGHRVSTGPVTRTAADVTLLHVDRTWVSPADVPDNPSQRPMLNGGVLDISKRRISRNLLTQNSGYEGPVIVKTDANAFGRPELLMQGRLSPRRLGRHLTRHLPWQWLRVLPRSSYPVLNSLAEVPAWVWQRPDLVVERFRPEREGDEFALRLWLFFGDQEYGARLFSRHPVVKTANLIHFEYLHSVPETLRAARKELGMDFGKFDYVEVDGETILLDVNKTPALSMASPRSDNLERLASGLEAYLA